MLNFLMGPEIIQCGGAANNIWLRSKKFGVGSKYIWACFCTAMVTAHTAMVTASRPQIFFYATPPRFLSLGASQGHELGVSDCRARAVRLLRRGPGHWAGTVPSLVGGGRRSRPLRRSPGGSRFAGAGPSRAAASASLVASK